jgi:UrcA family protein
MFKTFIIAAAVAAFIPAIASAQESPRQVSVQVADLDLTTTTGQAQANRRIEAAIRKVCDSVDQADLAQRAAARKCVVTARANAHKMVETQISSRQGVNGDKVAAR